MQKYFLGSVFCRRYQRKQNDHQNPVFPKTEKDKS